MSVLDICTASGKSRVEQPLTTRTTRKTFIRSQLWFKGDTGKVQLDTHLEGDRFFPFPTQRGQQDVQLPLSWWDNLDSLSTHGCFSPCSSCRPCCFLLLYPSSFLVDDISLTPIRAESEPMFLSLCIMSARSLSRQKLYGLHKGWHISPGIICKWTAPFLTCYHYNPDFPTTAWGNFCTSFQTKGISVLLTSHSGKWFVTFHKNDLKRHQQLFLRRLLGGYVPAQQLEATVT